MNTILILELARYNTLIEVVRENTVSLMKAVAGLVTMSTEL